MMTSWRHYIRKEEALARGIELLHRVNGRDGFIGRFPRKVLKEETVENGKAGQKSEVNSAMKRKSSVTLVGGHNKQAVCHGLYITVAERGKKREKKEPTVHRGVSLNPTQWEGERSDNKKKRRREEREF